MERNPEEQNPNDDPNSTLKVLGALLLDSFRDQIDREEGVFFVFHSGDEGVSGDENVVAVFNPVTGTIDIMHNGAAAKFPLRPAVGAADQVIYEFHNDSNQ